MPTDQYRQFNCYQILGIAPNATLPEIRSAYKRASLRSHPDRGGSHEAQVSVNLAYAILSNPIERQAHDIYWQAFSPRGFARTQAPDSYKPSQANTQSTQTRPQTPPRQTPRRETLAGLKKRVQEQIEKEKTRIWQDLDNRSRKNERDFAQQFSNLRQGTFFIFAGSISLAAIAIMIQQLWLWIGVIYLGWLLASRLNGVQIANRSYSLFDFNVSNKLKQHAQEVARESCTQDVRNVSRYISSLASLSELLLRSSTFDDSEEQIARRLAASFFLMGYRPVHYDRENRLLRFTDGEDTILVRFRHRAGVATNITYVQKLVGLLRGYGTTRSFLFCSPGLSGNAAKYAETNYVKWYTLETMNHWIQQVLVSDYSGPDGDTLRHLEALKSFLATISLAIPAKSYKTRSRYSRARF